LRTVGSALRLAALAGALLAPCAAQAARYVGIDADVRFEMLEGERGRARLHLLGASVRETIADSRGDRLILFGMVEARDDLSEVMLHELYARHKGPLGAWAVTVGRFRLPYGLMTDFDASRLLYGTPHETMLGMESDNGAMLSVARGAVNGAVSLTQGYGHHHPPRLPGHGIAMARVGVTPGETEEVSFGLSAAYGRTAHAHDAEMTTRRALVGADATFYAGRWLGRVEASAGRIDGRTTSAGFVALDAALAPGLDLNLAASAILNGPMSADEYFAGLTWRPRWLNVRGGYRHGGVDEGRHEVTLQAYRLFALGS